MAFKPMPGMRVGAYEIVAELGRGGMSVVLLARDEHLDRNVALKLLSEELAEDESFRGRFLREARVAAGLEHPNVVPVYDAGVAEGLLYIAMRYVAGADLKRVLEKGSMPIARSLDLLTQAASALDAAHAAGLVHRDVKPGNILVAERSSTDASEHAYLTDFGLAWQPVLADARTAPGAILGTLDYAAPEQLEGRPLDGRADVYSLGAVLFECLTGSVPFPRGSAIATITAHLHESPPRPSSFDPDLGPLDAVIARAMAKDRAERYGSCAALMAAARDACDQGASPPVVPPRERRTEERKLVTVLTCLVVDPVDEARSDPEDLREVQRSGLAAVRAEVQRFGGAIYRSSGDTVVGLFGAPTTHEDDAERALRAALGVLERARTESASVPKMRFGVETGEAVVEYDEATDGGISVSGTAVGASGRLASLASPGEVMVGETAKSLTERAVAFEATAGSSANAWRATRPLARPDMDGEDATPFVGRDLEFTTLTRLFERARDRASVELVTVIAEPGLGKSRLVREFRHWLDARPELVTWRVGRCLPFGDSTSFWALGEIVKSHAGILEGDDRSTIGEKLDAMLASSDPHERAWIKDRLAPLVGLDSDTATPTREDAFGAWCRLLERIAADGPTVLVIEDLHWADESFVEFLDDLVDRLSDLPLLLVTTTRPESGDPKAWTSRASRFSTIPLAPLADEDLGPAVATGLKGATPDVVSLVLARAEGSPLYAEQFVAMLRDAADPTNRDAIDAAKIPVGLQGLIGARVDALSEGARRTLRSASVLGRRFDRGALGAITEIGTQSETPLKELVHGEFLRPISGADGQEGFAFWHALTRDVAYAGLTRDERGRLHAGAARWIVGRSGDALGEEAEMVVHHLDQAIGSRTWEGPEAAELVSLLGRALVEAGEVAMRIDVPKATAYLERAVELLGEDESVDRLGAAGDRAHARGDVAAATNLLERALALDPANERARIRLGTELAAALRTEGRWAEASVVAERAVEQARAIGESGLEWVATVVLREMAQAEEGWGQRVRQEVEAIVPTLERASDHLALTKAWQLLSLALWNDGEYAAASDVVERALGEAERTGDRRQQDEIRAGLAYIAFYGPMPARDAIGRCEEVLEKVTMRASIGFTQLHFAAIVAMVGEFDRARELAERGRASLHEGGIGRWPFLETRLSAYVEHQAGELDAAASIWRAYRTNDTSTNPLFEYATLLLDAGHADEAMGLLETEGVLDVPERARHLSARARALLATGKGAEALSVASEAVTLAARTDALEARGDALIASAIVQAAMGERERARDSFREAIATYERKGHVVAVARTRDALAAAES